MRITLAVAVTCLTLGSLAAAGDATAAIRKSTDIPAQGLGPALTKLAKEFDFQVLYRTEIVTNLKSQPAVGALTSDEALGKVLSGTGLTYKYLDDNTVTIVPVSAIGSQSTSQSAPESSDGAGKSKEAGKKTSQDFRLAQVDQGKDSGTSSLGDQGSNSQEKKPSAGLEEIIVTAQKRSERLEDVPVPVTAISAEELTVNNLTRIQDYYSSVPGLSVGADGLRPGLTTISIRGITTGAFSNPTVGITVDDVPYGSSTLQGGGIYAPDIDPSDLQRVEVLRGPQGTLYGATAMGGLLKFVTVDPSTDAFSARVQADTNTVSHGAGPGYGGRASVNIPITDTFALRASGFARHDAGYVDNVQTGQGGVNWGDADGGHLSALWRPSDSFSLKVGALVQEQVTHGSPQVYLQPGLGDLQQAALLGTGAYKKLSDVYSANISAKLGGIDLAAISGYSINTIAGIVDLDPVSTTPPAAGLVFFDRNKTDKFSQEIRLSAAAGPHIDWLLGGYYTHEVTQWNQDLASVDGSSGAITQYGLFGSFPTTYTEYAAFGDLTFKLTDQFDVQIGGRESHNRQTYFPSETGPYVVPPLIGPEQNSSGNAFTYLFTPRYKFTPNSMIYARLASGYRPGGPNTPGPNVASEYSPDKNQNYEVGVKSDVLGRLLSVDASAYYIKWQDVQLPLDKGGNSYTANGGRAKSQGVEFSADSRPLEGLTISAWVVFSDAVITQPFPPATVSAGLYGVAGNMLPYSSRFSGHLSGEQKFPLTGTVTGLVGASISYVGYRQDVFSNGPTAPRQSLPAYAKTDLHAAVSIDTWTVTMYGNNVADKRGLLDGGLYNNPPVGFNIIQPRTLGLSVTKTF